MWSSYVKPHTFLTKETTTRWVKLVLQEAGIDISKYAAHSNRAASTSHAVRQDVNLQDIMNATGWTSSMKLNQ